MKIFLNFDQFYFEKNDQDKIVYRYGHVLWINNVSMEEKQIYTVIYTVQTLLSYVERQYILPTDWSALWARIRRIMAQCSVQRVNGKRQGVTRGRHCATAWPFSALYPSGHDNGHTKKGEEGLASCSQVKPATATTCHWPPPLLSTTAQVKGNSRCLPPSLTILLFPLPCGNIAEEAVQWR